MKVKEIGNRRKSRKRSSRYIQRMEPERVGASGSDRRIWAGQNDLKITLYQKSGDNRKRTKKTEQQLKRILDYMLSDREYKTNEIAGIVGVKESRARVLLAELVSAGEIEATGKNKGRRYKRR